MEDLKNAIDIYKAANGNHIVLFLLYVTIITLLSFRVWMIMPAGLKGYFLSILKHKRHTHLYSNAERMKYVIQTIDFNEDAKTLLFRKLLNIKIKKVCEVSKEVNIKAVDIWEEITSNVNKIISAYEREFYMFCVDRYESKGSEVAEYLLEAFGKYHQKNIDFILNSIQAAQDTHILNSNDDVVCYYHSLLNVAMQSGVIDCYEAFVAFNGHINHILNSKN